MGRKKILERRQLRITNKINDLKAKIQASEDLNEVRSLTAQVDELNADLADVTDEIAAIDEDANAEVRGFDPLGQTRTIASTGENHTGFDSMEYRSAFMAYVQHGTLIPQDIVTRAAGDTGITLSTEIGSLIPTTVMNEVIRNLTGKYGSIYAKVRKLNVQGGVKFPIANFAAELTWISEGTSGTAKKGADGNTYVSFDYHIGEVKISTSLLAAIVSLPIFEKELASEIAKAFLKAMDTAIIAGDGTDRPLGITVDPRVTNEIEMTAANMSDWKSWKTNLFAKIPLEKRGAAGEFLFAASTVTTYLETMHDQADRPLFKEATDLTIGNEGGKFFGHDVTLVEPTLIKDYDTASAGDVIGVYWDPNDYAVNSNLQFGVRRYFDEDNSYVDNGLVIVDGKILDASGCYLIKKK